jgi:PPM family protein phosphatase
VLNFFRELFRGSKSEQIPASTAVETAPFSEEQVHPVTHNPVHLHPPQLFIGTAQSAGMQRDHNEDTLYAMQAILADGNDDLPFGIFIIADGMGGHLNGEIASGTAARTLGEFLINRFYLPLLTGQPEARSVSIHEVLEEGVKEAQRAVLRSAPGGGTTLTAALVLGDQVTLSHVGDSRGYFIYPDGRIQVMTQDHSLVRRLQDLGQIDEKEASVHPQRNVLYRALGQSEPFRPDINTYPLSNSAYILLCSDGLWGSVEDADILRIIQSAPNLSLACHNLIEAANSAGGPDNISAVLVQYVN